MVTLTSFTFHHKLEILNTRKLLLLLESVKMEYSAAMLAVLVLAPQFSSSMNIKDRRLPSLSEIRKTLTVLQALLINIDNPDKR